MMRVEFPLLFLLDGSPRMFISLNGRECIPNLFFSLKLHHTQFQTSASQAETQTHSHKWHIQASSGLLISLVVCKLDCFLLLHLIARRRTILFRQHRSFVPLVITKQVKFNPWLIHLLNMQSQALCQYCFFMHLCQNILLPVSLG